MFGIGVPMTPELGVVIEDRLDQLDAALEPWAAAGGYFNFAERPCDADSILPAEVCERLAEVKRRRDPQATIVGAHPVLTTSAATSARARCPAPSPDTADPASYPSRIQDARCWARSTGL